MEKIDMIEKPNVNFVNELKDFVSDWSKKKSSETDFDQIFRIDGTPLSWFYRPILYSSLLPPPFTTIDDITNNREINSVKIKAFSYCFKKYLTLNDTIKRGASLIKKKKEDENKEKVLFLTFTNHLGKDTESIFRVGKLIKKFENDNHYQPFVLVVDPISRLSLKILNQCDHALYNYYDSHIIRKAKNRAKKLALRWKNISIKQKEQMLLFHGKNLFKPLKNNLDFLYSKEFITAVIRYYLSFRKIIRNNNIKSIVLSSQNNIFEKSLIAAANKENIPVFIIQHGIGLGSLATIDTPKNVKFAVFGEKYKRDLQQWGVDAKNIQITGPIIFEGIESFIKKKEIPKQRILLATSPLVEDRFMNKEEYFLKIKRTLTYLKKLELKIIIKLHPREKYQANYEEIVKELDLTAEISCAVDRKTHYGLIQNSDLVVTFGSTVALEAMIIGRPTLTIELFDGINPTNENVRNPKATTIVKYDQDILQAAKKVISENDIEKGRNFVEQLCYKIDGKAIKRITHFIYQEIDSFNKINENNITNPFTSTK
jgi:hypothetical protein